MNPDPSHQQPRWELPEAIPQPESSAMRLGRFGAQLRGRIRKHLTRPLRIMKFGGTSVGDASCIARVVDIVQAAARDTDVVVVVSAMSGVTNLLFAAAVHAAKGDYEAADVIFDGLRKQHELAIQTLFSSVDDRADLLHRLDQIFERGRRLCNAAASMRELSPAARDEIAGLGERLSAPLLAAALQQRGVRSEAVDAAQLIITDCCHGAAEPRMDLTRDLCRKNLKAVLQHGGVPVVTGYIGATLDGVFTTLGRGGSDYSATIIGAALLADEVIIWTDVDGILTADPRVIRNARTIPELSYAEASDLACFGAKVLHPKSLRPIAQSHIPVSIRNTFSPEKPGTRINSSGAMRNGHVKAITATSDVSLISVRGHCASQMPSYLRRIRSKAATAQSEMMLIAQSASKDELGFIVRSQVAESVERTLRDEFAQELTRKDFEQITADASIAVLTLVGHRAENMAEVIDRTLNALEREKIGVLALGQGSSASVLSFVIKEENVPAALHAAHREFQLGASGNGVSCGAAFLPQASPESARGTRGRI